MNLARWTAAIAAAALLGALPLRAQETLDTTARRQQRALDSLSAALKAVQDQLDSLKRAAATAPPAAPPPVVQPRASGSYMNIGFDGLGDAGWSSEPNVESLQRGDHDPIVNGFTVPNFEMTLDATVDPYFKGVVDIVYKLDSRGETGLEFEEGYLITTSLPWNMQVKAGQFYTEFGRQNAMHPHAWSFVDQPLVLNRMFGPDGLRSQGARISWLFPTPWYTEAMLSVLNATGGTTWSFRSDESGEIHGGLVADSPVRRLHDLLVVPRLATSFDLTGTQTVLLGLSGAFGPNNTGPDARTGILGADLYWKWKSARAAAGFPFVSWQTEALTRRYDAAPRIFAQNAALTLPDEALKDRGVYSQVLWGIKPRVVVGVRGDLVTADPASFDSDLRAKRSRLSPNLTWYPTEFSKLRLQYNLDHRKGIGNDHSLWLQFEFIMGAHAAHKF